MFVILFHTAYWARQFYKVIQKQEVGLEHRDWVLSWGLQGLPGKAGEHSRTFWASACVGPGLCGSSCSR